MGTREKRERVKDEKKEIARIRERLGNVERSEERGLYDFMIIYSIDFKTGEILNRGRVNKPNKGRTNKTVLYSTHTLNIHNNRQINKNKLNKLS